jgi:putative membrane protein
MKRIVMMAVLLVVAMFGLSFALINADPVQLNYYLGTIQAPLSLVLVFALALGAGLGVLATMGVVLKQKRELARLRKSVKLTEKEVANLRSLPLKDQH